MEHGGFDLHLYILSFVVGTACLPWLPVSGSSTVGVATLLVALSAIGRRRFPHPMPLVLAGVACGIIYVYAHAAYWLDQRLSASGETVERTLVGVVSGFPRQFDRLTRVELELDHPVKETSGGRLPRLPGLFYGTVRLNCYDCRQEFAPGQTWRLAARLRGVHGLANPGLFDYERWAFQRRLVATGTLLDAPGNRMLDDGNDDVGIAPLRREFNAFLDRALENLSGAAIVRAITLGVRDDIGEAQWRIFRRTGTGHLVAISGLHITLVFSFVFALASAAARLCPPLLRRVPAQRVAALAALPPTLCYAAMAGFSLPTQRAGIMLSVFYVALLLGRRVMGWHTFCVALALVILIDPFATLSAGFWLSFGAVAAIIVYVDRARRWAEPYQVHSTSIMRRINERMRRLVAGWITVQLAVSAVVVPMAGLFFDELAIASPLFNLFAIPYFSLAVVPPALLGIFAWLSGIPDAAAALLGVAAQCATWMQHALGTGANWPFVSMPCDPVDVLRWLLVTIIAAGVAHPVARRALGPVSLSLLVSTTGLPPPPRGAFTATVLDVGQGLSILVRTRDHTLVYDTGIRYGPGYDMGDIVVNPSIARGGDGSLDVLIVSHGDRDHAGGRAAVTGAHPSATVYTGEWHDDASGHACIDGMEWVADAVRFTFLSPPDASPSNSNNRSCVLRISSAYGAMLLPGDIEDDAERALVARHRDGLAANVLVVPHHGSRTSSTATLLEAVDPEVAIVSRGLTNPFGHPHESVAARYLERGVTWFDTAFDGAVSVSVGPRGVYASGYRQRSRPPWRSQPSRTAE